MKIFFAGNAGHGKAGIHRENLLKNLAKTRLFSFFWCGEDRDFYKHFLSWGKESINENSIRGRGDIRP